MKIKRTFDLTEALEMLNEAVMKAEKRSPDDTDDRLSQEELDDMIKALNADEEDRRKAEQDYKEHPWVVTYDYDGAELFAEERFKTKKEAQHFCKELEEAGCYNIEMFKESEWLDFD